MFPFHLSSQAQISKPVPTAVLCLAQERRAPTVSVPSPRECPGRQEPDAQEQPAGRRQPDTTPVPPRTYTCFLRFLFLSYLLYFTECVVSFCVQSLWKEGINPK